MDILQNIISIMQKEDFRSYKLFAQRTAVNKDRKDTALVDYVKKNGIDYNEHIIFEKLYPNEDKNAFYRLKNRVVDDLNKSLTIQHFEKDTVMYLYHLLSISKFYSQRKNYDLALYFLKKAEKYAEEAEHYELLRVIYSEYLVLSHKTMVDPAIYIEKRKKAEKRLNQIIQMDDILAMLHHKLTTSQNYSGNSRLLLDDLQKTIDEFVKDDDVKSSPLLKTKIYDAVSTSLLQQHDYKNLEIFLLQTFDDFSSQKLFIKANHRTKLQMLTYLANTLYKNKKFKESLSYTTILHEAMNEFDKKFYTEYAVFYYSSLVNNYSRLNPDKALEILNDLQTSKIPIENPFYRIFIHVNQAIIHYDKSEYKKAAKHLSSLYLLDTYESADSGLRLKIQVAELIIRYELNDDDQLNRKIKEINKLFSSILSLDLFRKENEFIKLITLLNQHKAVLLKEKKVFLQKWYSAKEDENTEDSEIISYRHWLDKVIH